MRLLIVLLGLVALAMAPLPASGLAMAAQMDECLAASAMHQHQHSDHRAAGQQGCCLVAPATILPPLGNDEPCLERAVLALFGQSKLNGIVLDGEDPPPRAV